MLFRSNNAPDSVFQMVSVFDGNPDTKVVCEGYAKAFQYLCDLSTFKSAKCYTVSGNMAGGTGAGGHMWNIVSIGSSNYLVDVTNCDDGAVGSPDKLFMAIPSSGAWNGTYTFSAASNITYTYGSDQIGYYGESILKLATTPYDPTKEPVEDDTNKPDADKANTSTAEPQASNQDSPSSQAKAVDAAETIISEDSVEQNSRNERKAAFISALEGICRNQVFPDGSEFQYDASTRSEERRVGKECM